MGDEVTRQECQNSMARLHERVDEISKCSITIKETAKNIGESVDKMFKVVYGNGQNGLLINMSKTIQEIDTIKKEKLNSTKASQWRIGLIVGIIISTVNIVFKFLVK